MSLSEYIWNYIRNTANILNQFTEHITFSGDNHKKKILFKYSVEQEGKNYFPHLYVTTLVKSDFISFVYKKNSINVENIKLLNKFDLQKKKEFKEEANYMDDLMHIAFEGEILNQDVIAMYIKSLILPEYGGLDEVSIQSIFSKV
ncbi:hypothetical protein HMPREF9130_0907 [Peptoniphilus sp. oral taxon 375 str. F0436]|nr:hypothetical protein HMPREF9130_0907 [Peptoniphilus sp. oral taxon 375 str. F0436]